MYIMGEKMDKKELMLVALQQRIAELVAGYEMQIAALRAEITTLSEMDNKEEQ